MKYFLGIDIALRKTGIVIVDEKGEILYRDVLIVPAKYDYTAAVKIIYDYFINLKIPSGADEVVWVVEDVLGMVHIKAGLAIHAARTAVVLAYHNSHISKKSIIYHTPNEVKYWLTGKRGAKKPEMEAALIARFPEYDFSLLSEDEKDALALVLYTMKGVKSADTISRVKPRRSHTRVGNR